jgi:hypothetical protein
MSQKAETLNTDDTLHHKAVDWLLYGSAKAEFARIEAAGKDERAIISAEAKEERETILAGASTLN